MIWALADIYLFQHDHKPASCVKAVYVPEECICQERIVRYVSKAFKRSMLIMPTFYKEAKAVVLVLSSCRYYIDNSPFCVHVFGDHCPLKWIHTCMKGPVSAWMNVELAGIYFKYHYFPGPQNVIADALSRYPVVQSEVTGFHGATAIWSALFDRLSPWCRSARSVWLYAGPDTKAVERRFQAWRVPTNAICVSAHVKFPSSCDLALLAPATEKAPKVAARLFRSGFPFAILMPSDLVNWIAVGEEGGGCAFATAS